MELLVVLVIGGIVASYAYGCGSEFGDRLGRFIIRQGNRHRPK